MMAELRFLGKGRKALRRQSPRQLTQKTQEIHKDAKENKTEQEHKRIRKTGKEIDWLNSRKMKTVKARDANETGGN